eukprot:1159645-Pelagomonas_calceolata.AAC.4
MGSCGGQKQRFDWGDTKGEGCRAVPLLFTCIGDCWGGCCWWLQGVAVAVSFEEGAVEACVRTWNWRGAS